MTATRKFKPDTRTLYADDEGKIHKNILAESITQTGGVLVVTAHRCNDERIRYGLTHTLTGGSLTGAKPVADIDQLKKAARRFWRALTDKQKKVWKTSSDRAAVQAAVSPDAIRELKR